MTAVGKNMRIEVASSRRPEMRRFYAEALGCELSSPMRDFDAFRFDDGFVLGAYYVEDDAALSPQQWKRAPWIELRVEDVDAIIEALATMHITPFEYHDPRHRYFEGPGGLVFRLTGTS